MPNFTTETAVARHAVTLLDSPVNVIVKLLKRICERAAEIDDRVFFACGMAQGKLDAFERNDLSDEINERRKSVANDLLEIEIAAHDLDELIDLIKKVTA